MTTDVFGETGDASEFANVFGDETGPPEAPETPAVVEAPADPETPDAPQAGEEPSDPADARTRDEKGRFAKTEAAAAEERIFAGKYRTPDDLERAYEELQSLHGRTSQEIGELRRLVEGQQPQPQQSHDVDQLDAWFEENPHQIQAAAQQALQSQDGVLYDRALNAWYDLDPRGAGRFEREVEAAAMEHRLAQKYAPVEQQHNVNEWQQAIVQFGNSEPEFKNVPDAEIIAAAQRNPYAQNLLANERAPTPIRIEALRTLFLDALHARGRNSDTLAAHAQTLAQQQAEATLRAKQEASTVSATATVPEASLSPAEKIGAQWSAMTDPLNDGWLTPPNP